MARAAAARAAAPAAAPRKPRTTRAPAKRAPATKSRSTRASAAAPAKRAPATKSRSTRASAAAPAKRTPARRRSGPATAPRRAPRPAAPRPAPAPLGKRLTGQGNLLLDRLLRGRLWVVCVGVLLAGIVFLNVGLLQLNDQIGRTDKKSGSIGRENAALRIELAKLDSTERIQRLAAAKGFVMPAPGAVRYIHAKARDARNAARHTIAPQPQIAPVPVAAPATGVPGTTPAVPGTTAPGTTTPVAPAPVQQAPAAATAPAAAVPATAQQVP